MNGALHPAAWTRIALARWRTTAAAAAVITIVAVAGLLRLQTAVGYRAFLGAEHPVVQEFDEFVERFGGGLPLLAVWSCATSTACNSALDDASLAMAYGLVQRLNGIAAIRLVDSPATSGLLFRPQIGLPRLRTFFRDGAIVADADELRHQALNDPAWVRRLVAADGGAGAIVLHLRDSASTTAKEAFAALRAAVRPYEEAGFSFAFVGGPVEFVVAAADLQRNTQRIMPVMVAVIAVALMLLFGAPLAALVALACVGLAVVWTLGLMGWLGWAQNSLTQILPPLVLVVGVCDAVHLLGRYTMLAGASDPRAAIAAAARDVGKACAVTTLTTVAGFASLAVSGLESIARFGLLASAGVIASLVLTFTVLPLLAVALPRDALARRRTAEGLLHHLDRLAVWSAGAARRWILVAAVGAAVVGVAGVRHLEVEATFEDLYGEDSDVVRWAVETERVLRAPDTLEIAVVAPPGSDGMPAQAFAVVDRIQHGIAASGELGPSLSIVDVMRHLNGMLHGDELPLVLEPDDKGRPASLYRLLRSRAAALIDDLVDARRPALRISAESAKLPQARLRALLAAVAAEVDAALPDGWSAVITGPLAVVSRMIDAIRTTQLQSFALAAVAVFAAVAVAFRSIRLAAAAMVPTALPVVVTLGVMGVAGVALDVGSAMVASVVLGLAVDDAVHILSRWTTAVADGAAVVEANRRALVESGRAVVATSLALAVGFATLTFSAWQSIASFGVIAAVAILTALVAAVVVLPALLAARPFRG